MSPLAALGLRQCSTSRADYYLPMAESRRKSPWWQMTSSPKWGFLLGGGYLVVAAGAWVTAFTSEDLHPLKIMIALVMSLLGLAHLGSATAMRRRGQGS